MTKISAFVDVKLIKTTINEYFNNLNLIMNETNKLQYLLSIDNNKNVTKNDNDLVDMRC